MPEQNKIRKIEKIDPAVSHSGSYLTERYEDFAHLSNLDLNQPGAEKGLAMLLTGGEGENFLNDLKPTQIAQLKSANLAGMQDAFLAYVAKNYGQIVSQLPSQGLAGLVLETPVAKETGDKTTSEAVKEYQRQKQLSEEDPGKYIKEQLKNVSPGFQREVLGIAGEELLAGFLQDAQFKALIPFLDNKGQKINPAKINSFLQAQLSYYQSQEKPEEKAPGYEVAMKIAGTAYQVTKAKQAQAKSDNSNPSYAMAA